MRKKCNKGKNMSKIVKISQVSLLYIGHSEKLRHMLLSRAWFISDLMVLFVVS